MNQPKNFNLEDYAARCINYLDRMVDANGLPYFNIFWTNPAEAAHDWPDFGDVMSRQLQGAIMVRRMTGLESTNEKLWLKKVLGLINSEDGLLYRPATSFSEHVADWGDAALTLYSLATAALDSADEKVKAAALKMVDGLVAKMRAGDAPASWIYGFVIKSLMVCARCLGSSNAADLAGDIARAIFEQGSTFSPDNTFRHGGHMHGNLRTLVGLADYALYTKDPILFSRVDALYRYVRSTGTPFGFIPEVISRHDDLVLCETCALMDYIGLGATLANHGHPEYWNDIERTVRNQLVESQATDGDWLASETSASDTDQFSWREIGDRIIGAWAGWSSPTQILAAQETLQWGGPELRGKTRAFQNCCGGSGAHALFIAWKNSARFEKGVLSIHMHFDKLLPQAEIRCQQPYRGVLTIALKQDCKVRVRIPDFVPEGKIAAKSNIVGDIAGTFWGNYLELGQRQAGELLIITYPLTEWDEETSIGNPGGRQYRYRVSWKGDTVIKIQPLDEESRMGYSEVEKRDVEVYYGEHGPHRLYQRETMREDLEPAHGALTIDDGGMDFWAGLAD